MIHARTDIKTLNPQRRMYIGYDLGDLFYDNPGRIEAAKAWVREKIEVPALKQGKYIKIVFIRFTNVLRKPGPMFNFLAASAFGDGAHYMYRCAFPPSTSSFEQRGGVRAQSLNLDL